MEVNYLRLACTQSAEIIAGFGLRGRFVGGTVGCCSALCLVFPWKLWKWELVSGWIHSSGRERVTQRNPLSAPINNDLEIVFLKIEPICKTFLSGTLTEKKKKLIRFTLPQWSHALPVMSFSINQRVLCSDPRESELKLFPVQRWTHIQSWTPTVKCRGGHCLLIPDSVELTTNISWLEKAKETSPLYWQNISWLHSPSSKFLRNV